MERRSLADTVLGMADSFLGAVLRRPPLRIGMVCDPRMGGSSTVAANLGSDLSRRGHTVHFVAFDAFFSPPDKGCTVHVVEDVSRTTKTTLNKDPALLTIASKISAIAKSEALQVINVHYALPYAISAYLGRQMLADGGVRVPIITTLHGTDVHTIGPTENFKDLMTFSLKNSDGVTAVSNYLAETATANFGRENIKVIYNFVDPEAYRPRESGRVRGYYAKPNEKILFHASNFRPLKRIGDIIQALALMKTPAKLLLAGDGPERPRMEALAQKLGVADRVVFLGRQQNLPALYNVADVSLLVSENESFGMTLIESMASEVPVVATRVGGMPEVMQDGVQGRLVEKGDVAGIAGAVEDILADPDKQKRMGRKGRKRVLERFTPQKIVPRYERYYRSFL